MKKAGIVTIVSYNYGNRLQNFALQQALKQVGIDSVTIVRDKKELKIKNRIKKIICSIRKKTKFDNFCNFNRNINWSKESVEDFVENKKSLDNYSCFIAGSDQVWNVTFPFISEQDFLSFVPAEKRFSYAASFGINHIPDEHYQMVQDNLQKFRAVSVREESGAKLVKELTDKDAKVVLDPTMLLGKDEWAKIERKPNGNLPSNYVFTYFLGENKNRQFVSETAKKLGCQVVELNIFDKKFTYNNIGPAEFLYLIHHSKMVITDSFHSSVFSLLFHTPFVVCERQTGEKNMSSRIDTLLGTFNLSQCRYGENFDLQNVLNLDFSKSDKILMQKRSESFEFITNSLGMI